MKNDLLRSRNLPALILVVTLSAFLTVLFFFGIHSLSLSADAETLSEPVPAPPSPYESICIGSNKEWVDEQLGTPEFICSHENYLQCVYVDDLAVVNVFYDKEVNACDGFFVTLRHAEDRGKINLPQAYRSCYGDKTLGEFTYADVTDSNMAVTGYVTNGIPRTFYGESYYNGSSTNYMQVCALYLDYGYDENAYSLCFRSELNEEQKAFYDKILGENNHTMVNPKRDSTYPNTYGITKAAKSEIMNLIASYNHFDSFHLYIED